MNIIYQEKPSLATVFFRKPSIVRKLETILFINGLLLAYFFIGYNKPIFKVVIVATAFLILGLSPLLYKFIVRPEYILTNTQLIIYKLNKKVEIPLIKVDQSLDLKFFYLIDGKKTILTVSNKFIDKLEEQLALIRKNLK